LYIYFVYISDSLANISFIFQLSIVKLLEVPAHNANISMEMLSLFIDSNIDNVLL